MFVDSSVEIIYCFAMNFKNDDGKLNLIKILEAEKINNNQAKEVLKKMFSGGKKRRRNSGKGFEQISDAGEIEKIVDEVMTNNQNQVTAYRNGNEKLFGFSSGKQ